MTLSSMNWIGLEQIIKKILIQCCPLFAGENWDLDL